MWSGFPDSCQRRTAEEVSPLVPILQRLHPSAGRYGAYYAPRLVECKGQTKIFFNEFNKFCYILLHSNTSHYVLLHSIASHECAR